MLTCLYDNGKDSVKLCTFFNIDSTYHVCIFLHVIHVYAIMLMEIHGRYKVFVYEGTALYFKTAC